MIDGEGMDSTETANLYASTPRGSRRANGGAGSAKYKSRPATDDYSGGEFMEWNLIFIKWQINLSIHCKTHFNLVENTFLLIEKHILIYRKRILIKLDNTFYLIELANQKKEFFSFI